MSPEKGPLGHSWGFQKLRKVTTYPNHSVPQDVPCWDPKWLSGSCSPKERHPLHPNLETDDSLFQFISYEPIWHIYLPCIHHVMFPAVQGSYHQSARGLGPLVAVLPGFAKLLRSIDPGPAGLARGPQYPAPCRCPKSATELKVQLAATAHSKWSLECN